jgi:hypothetical protein
MVPGLSIAFYTCATTNATKFDEFHTTSLGQNDGRTWSPVFSTGGSDAAQLGNFTANLSATASSLPPLSSGSESSSHAGSSLAVIVGSVIGGVVFVIALIAIVCVRLQSQKKRKLGGAEISSGITQYKPVTNIEGRDEHPMNTIARENVARHNETFNAELKPLSETALAMSLLSTEDTAHHKFVDVADLGLRSAYSKTQRGVPRYVSNWPETPRSIEISRWSALQRCASDIAVILISVAFLVYASLVRAYEGVPTDHSMARTLLKLASLVSILSQIEHDHFAKSL